MADNDKLSRGTLIGFIGGLIGVALTASSGNEQLIAGAFVVGCILGVIFGTVKSDWKQGFPYRGMDLLEVTERYARVIVTDNDPSFWPKVLIGVGIGLALMIFANWYDNKE